MEMFRKHTSPLLAIIALLLSCITTSDAQVTYNVCYSYQYSIYINNRTSPFLIRSPNYGQISYGDGLNCSLVIRSGAEPLVLSLDIKDFELESQSSCNYDYLCVHGTKFCGDWLSGYKFQYILPENSRFTVLFKTDGSVTERGFNIEISQDQARTYQAVAQPTGYVASSNTTFSYTLETYYPGYPYTDLCVVTRTSASTTSRFPYSTTPSRTTVPTTSRFPYSTTPSRTTVPITSQIPDSTTVPISTTGLPTSRTTGSSTVPTSTVAPTTSRITDSTTAAPPNGAFCYSAAQVQLLNEIINNATAGLNAARELLFSRK